jgi:hypothetical protein
VALQSGSVGDAWSQIVRLKILFRPTLEEKEYDQQQKKCEPHGHQGNQGQFTGHGRNSNSLLRLGIRRRSGQVRLCLIRRCHREILLIRSRCLSWKRVLILFLFGAKWIVMFPDGCVAVRILLFRVRHLAETLSGFPRAFPWKSMS